MFLCLLTHRRKKITFVDANKMFHFYEWESDETIMISNLSSIISIRIEEMGCSDYLNLEFNHF